MFKPENTSRHFLQQKCDGKITGRQKSPDNCKICNIVEYDKIPDKIEKKVMQWYPGLPAAFHQ